MKDRFIVHCLNKKCKISYITISKANRCNICRSKVRRIKLNEDRNRSAKV